MKMMVRTLLLGATALVLAACGSSNHDDAPPAPVVTTDIPATATTDAAGLTAFVNGQIGSTSDTAEPILVGDAVLPLDDSTETSL